MPPPVPPVPPVRTTRSRRWGRESVDGFRQMPEAVPKNIFKPSHAWQFPAAAAPQYTQYMCCRGEGKKSDPNRTQ